MLGERLTIIAPSLPRHAMLRQGERSAHWNELAERFSECMIAAGAVDQHSADRADPATAYAVDLV